MIEMDWIERDLLEMKANTLYKYGKKIELVEEMYLRKLRLLSRLVKMLARARGEQIIKSGWFKDKRQQELIARIEDKAQRTERTVAKLEEMKEKYIEDFKQQREACGLIDHSFLDKFYKDW